MNGQNDCSRRSNAREVKKRPPFPFHQRDLPKPSGQLYSLSQYKPPSSDGQRKDGDAGKVPATDLNSGALVPVCPTYAEPGNLDRPLHCGARAQAQRRVARVGTWPRDAASLHSPQQPLSPASAEFRVLALASKPSSPDSATSADRIIGSVRHTAGRRPAFAPFRTSFSG